MTIDMSKIEQEILFDIATKDWAIVHTDSLGWLIVRARHYYRQERNEPLALPDICEEHIKYLSSRLAEFDMALEEIENKE